MRTAEIKRKTKETDIEVFVKLDGDGKVSVNTGIGFFDHMLTALGVHSGIDMEATFMLTDTTQLRTLAYAWAKPLRKHWATKQALQDMARLLCRWTKRWRSAHWI